MFYFKTFKMDIKFKNKILTAVFVTGVLTMLTQPAMSQREYVKNFDVQRYVGVWYEIARFPHKFEKNLVGVTATYTMNPDGRITVENAGRFLTLGGKVKKAMGKAKFAGSEQHGHLKVSFFLWFYADYYIMALDENYQWALIGSTSDDYLWILSRSPHMEQEIYGMLLEKARSMGYNLANLQQVPQELP